MLQCSVHVDANVQPLLELQNCSKRSLSRTCDSVACWWNCEKQSRRSFCISHIHTLSLGAAGRAPNYECVSGSEVAPQAQIVLKIMFCLNIVSQVSDFGFQWALWGPTALRH